MNPGIFAGIHNISALLLHDVQQRILVEIDELRMGRIAVDLDG